MIRTRFAPSPTGPLHLGHAYSAIIAHDFAKSKGGKFSVRIEDLDQSRARAEWEDQIFDDLAWLGLTWETPVLRQSGRDAAYRDALKKLWTQSLLYPCSCSRKDIKAAASAPQEGQDPTFGPDGVIYPGTCRPLHPHQGTQIPKDCVLRLDMARAVAAMPNALSFQEIFPKSVGLHTFSTVDAPQSLGDVVVSRQDMSAAYHLAVVVDDADQDISHVVRGLDLQDATDIHVVLQRCLGLSTPIYLHHELIRDSAGKRLAKRDDAKSISKFRAEGATPRDIRRMVGL